MNYTLTARNREELGSAAAVRIRKAGEIPAIIYSKSGNVNIIINQKEFEKEYLKGNAYTSVAEIELASKKIAAIPHKVDVDAVTGKPTHVDFLPCDDKLGFRVKAKINFINQEKSPGLKKGGFLHVMLRRVELVCDSNKSVIGKVDVDVSSMQVGGKIKTSDLVLPTGVKLAGKKTYLIASMIGRGMKEEVEVAATTADGAAAPAAAGAAGAAAPAAAAGGKAAAPAGKAAAPAPGGKAGEKKPTEKADKK